MTHPYYEKMQRLPFTPTLGGPTVQDKVNVRPHAHIELHSPCDSAHISL